MPNSCRATSSRGEPVQLDALDAGGPVHLGQPRQQRVAPMELVAAERDQEQQPLLLGIADQEGQELPGGVVRPVEVLDGEDDRSPLAQPAQQLEERLVGSAAGPIGAELGRGRRRRRAPAGGQAEPARHRHQGVALGAAARVGGGIAVALEHAHQRPDGLDDRRERERALGETDAAAQQHGPHPRRGPGS